MDSSTACLLAEYINHNSSRFSAETQEFQEQNWVIIRDARPAPSSRYIEPILYLETYLERTDRPRPLDPEFRRLLERWQAKQKDRKSEKEAKEFSS